MENTSVRNYEDPIMSSQPTFPANMKLESYLDEPLLPPGVSHSPTYTPLEPVYPETSIATTSSQYFAQSSLHPSSMQPIYAYSPNAAVGNTDPPFFIAQPLYSQIHLDVSHIPKDEGLGSSPASSYSSISPPILQAQAANHGQTVPSRPSSSFDYTANHGQTVPSRPSSSYDYAVSSVSNSPANAGSPNFPTAPECSNCGSRYDNIWNNGHYLCRQCFLERPTVVTAPPALAERSAVVNARQILTEKPAVIPNPTILDDQMNGGKRKRASGTDKNLNQVCTNCESPHSKLWRRSISTGFTVCNACGLYEKLHHVPRPKSMRKDTIQTRKRKPKAADLTPNKKSPKKAKKNLQEIQEQHQYTPNAVQYSLPQYPNLELSNLHPEMNSHTSQMIPSINQQFFINYRPEVYRHDIYNPVSPNDIINAGSNIQFTNS